MLRLLFGGLDMVTILRIEDGGKLFELRTKTNKTTHTVVVTTDSGKLRPF